MREDLTRKSRKGSRSGYVAVKRLTNADAHREVIQLLKEVRDEE